MNQCEIESLTVEDALRFALECHQRGLLDTAETLYRRVLIAAPAHPDALHFLGLLSHQFGRTDEAVALIRRAIEAAPHAPGPYNNLGNIFKLQGRYDDSAAMYRKAIELAPDNAEACNNLGVLHSRARRSEEAQRWFERALRIRPAFADAWHNLGNLHKKRKRYQQAEEAYRRALALDPDHGHAYYNLAYALTKVGRTDAARDVYHEWLGRDPDNAVARHMLAALTGDAVPARASNEYVRDTFDQFAESFDEALLQLEYRAPELVAEAFAQVSGGRKGLRILDAGCGTGLCGVLLKPYAAHLTGVDLSSGMLRQARQRGVYDDLVEAELTSYMQSRRHSFDAVISADTLNYFGDLEPVMVAARESLREGGQLLFTVEHLQDVAGKGGFHLNAHGRYSHTRDYLLQVLSRAGFADISESAAILRKESGAPVTGLLICATAP
jgi:predicted TPR repeat methyltransferase